MLFISSVQALEKDLVFQLKSGTHAEINAIVAPIIGMMVYNTDDNKIYDYNGTAWASLHTPPTVIAKTASYVLTENDNGAVLTFNSSTAMTLTIPSGLPIGYNVSVYQIDTGKVTIIGSGATIKNRLSRFKTAGKNAGVGIVSTSTDVYHLSGDLKK